MKIKILISIIFSSIIYFANATQALAGLGISPSQLISPNLSKGSHIEKIFILSRSDPKVDLQFSISLEGSTKDWITLDKNSGFIMAAGIQRFPITIYVDVPNDAISGRYKGGIRLTSTSTSPINTVVGVSTAYSALIPIELTITRDLVTEYEILAIGMQNSEEGNPLGVILTVNNTGNIAAGPKKVRIHIYDKTNTDILESQDIFEIGSAKPLSISDIIIPVSTSLGIGQYWARISAYNEDSLIKDQNIVFEIIEPGSHKQISQNIESKFEGSEVAGKVLASNTSIFVIVFSMIMLFIVIVAVVYFVIIKTEKK